ncbi:MAG: hypothetical protein B7Z73_06875 [Planctomycetia bacterium 21-64-5]|nr:MAG: hypothetical protein B7Z73_06875 [Planctomycetia bacterium 21-64-5]HQU42558.1 FliG C-terminal domain-containing protein [Pirellulales bacterium]
MSKIDERLRRAAILIASLDDAVADQLLEQLPAEEAARLRRTVVELHGIAPGEERQVIGDFLRRPAAPAHPGVELDAGLARRLSQDHRPAQTDQGDSTKPFRFLHDAHGEKLTPFIAGERPQTIAVVISHLPDDRAAAVLATLEGELQAEVIQRLIDLDQADPEIVREVERGLESRMLEQAVTERRQESGLQSVARILDAARPALRRAIMTNLARHDRPLAQRLRPQRFEFDDLRGVDDATLATILAAAGSELARLALAGADEELVERILGPLTPLEAKKMRRMIENLGPVRLSDVEEAQREVARIACQLALEGRIDLPNGAEVLAKA